MYAQVARAQLRANHVQHIRLSSRITSVPRGAKGQLVLLSLTEFKSPATKTLFSICEDGRLIGPIVKTSASRVADLGLVHAFGVDCFLDSVIPDSEIDNPVPTLPGAWSYRVSAGTGWPGVSILCLGDMKSLICSFQLFEQICPCDTLPCF